MSIELFGLENIPIVDGSSDISRIIKEAIEKITKLMLNDVKVRLKNKNITVEFTDKLIEHISKVGFDQVYGARPLRRAIQNNIEDMLAEEILDGKIKVGSNIIVNVENEKIITSNK